uniref:Uncharacterized protein n=1 Tax=Oryzias latipes TaxID=8090 RepID=A0A3P9I1W1_ORYLA
TLVAVPRNKTRLTSAGGHNTIVLQAEPPKDHIIWSLCCFLYSNPLCLGLAALIFSIKSRDRKVVGDLEGARHYGATARCLNIAATIIVCLTIIIVIIVFAVIASQVLSKSSCKIIYTKRSTSLFFYDKTETVF